VAAEAADTALDGAADGGLALSGEASSRLGRHREVGNIHLTDA
jgi:hypothetical protein